VNAAHIVGAGVAGLAAADTLIESGWIAQGGAITLYDQAPRAGGRCRSWVDKALGCEIDNGNHLLLACNPTTLGLIAKHGPADALAGPETARFDFADLRDGTVWSLRPNAGPFPWWIFAPRRRTPGGGALAHLAGAKLLFAGADAVAADCFPVDAPLYERLWRPLCEAVMNADAQEASARLLGRVFRETFAGGASAMRPYIARRSLDDALIAPMRAAVEAAGGVFRFGARLKAIDVADGRATTLRFGETDVALGAEDVVILATPPDSSSTLLPNLPTPQGARPIVNAHFRLAAALTPAPTFFGVVGAATQWVFLRGDLASVTVSAADALAAADAETLAVQLWRETAKALQLQGYPIEKEPLPPFRIVKEKRATFAQTPSEVRKRPAFDAGPKGVFLAGDWTATGLPATIEGAARSGVKAAENAANRR